MQVSTRVAALVTTAALSFASLGAPAFAEDEAPVEPCATQTAQVEKAEDALERVTAVFEKAKAKVKKAKKVNAKADTAREKAAARKKLKAAKEDRADAAKTKKAQVQRLAKAEERLAKCLAAQEQPEEQPEEEQQDPAA